MTNRRPETAIERTVEAAKGLAHPARLRILAMLARGELCVCQLVCLLGFAPSTVSQHLSVLAHGGFVALRKEGKLAFYRLRGDGLAAALLPAILAGLSSDPIAKADRTLASRVRRLPVSTLCAANLDLETAELRQPTPARARLATRRGL